MFYYNLNCCDLLLRHELTNAKKNKIFSPIGKQMLSYKDIDASNEYLDNETFYIFWQKHFMEQYHNYSAKASNNMLVRFTPLLALRKENIVEPIVSVINTFLADNEPTPLDLLTYHVLRRFTKTNEPDKPFCCNKLFFTMVAEMDLMKTLRYSYQLLSRCDNPWILDLPNNLSLINLLIELAIKTKNEKIFAIISKDITSEQIQELIEKSSIEMLMTLVINNDEIPDFFTKWESAFNNAKSHSFAALEANDYVCKYLK